MVSLFNERDYYSDGGDALTRISVYGQCGLPFFPTIEARCRAALGTALGSVVDVSANRTALELSGPAARSVLETSCSLDLHPRTFAAGRCAQTSLARIPVILHQLTEEPRYRILVRPSFAIHLATWLKDAWAGVGMAAPPRQ